MIQPTYYVKHPDGAFTVAAPQPVLIAFSKCDCGSSNDAHAFDCPIALMALVKDQEIDRAAAAAREEGCRE